MRCISLLGCVVRYAYCSTTNSEIFLAWSLILNSVWNTTAVILGWSYTSHSLLPLGWCLPWWLILVLYTSSLLAITLPLSRLTWTKSSSRIVERRLLRTGHQRIRSSCCPVDFGTAKHHSIIVLIGTSKVSKTAISVFERISEPSIVSVLVSLRFITIISSRIQISSSFIVVEHSDLNYCEYISL